MPAEPGYTNVWHSAGQFHEKREAIRRASELQDDGWNTRIRQRRQYGSMLYMVEKQRK